MNPCRLRSGLLALALVIPMSGCGIPLSDSISFIMNRAAQESQMAPDDLDPEFGTDVECSPLVC